MGMFSFDSVLQHWRGSEKVNFGTGPGEFNCPWGVAVSADKHIFVANYNGKLQKSSFSSYKASADVRGNGVAIHPISGKIFTTVGDQVFNDNLTPSYSFNIENVDGIMDIAIDTKGMVYVTDPSKGHVLKFTPEGKHLATIGSKGGKPHQFVWPLGICIDSNDIMYVTDSDKHKIKMFTTEGEYLGCVYRWHSQSSWSSSGQDWQCVCVFHRNSAVSIVCTFQWSSTGV